MVMSDHSSIPLVENGKFPNYTAVKGMAKYRTDHVGWRLAKRKELFARKRKAALISLLLALVGVLFMVIETEVTIARHFAGKEWKHTPGSILIKLGITFTSLGTIGWIAWYYMTDVKLFMVDNSLDDWRLALNRSTIIGFVVEVIIVLMHPLPGDVEYSYMNEKGIRQRVPVDVVLSLPMCLRMYLAGRVVMLNSRLFTDAISQSLGALNRVSFDYKFVFKSLMTQHPSIGLSIIVGVIFLISSWYLRACEMYHEETDMNIPNAMWVVAITYLTVGYGDIYPKSYCGRTVSVTVGVLGVFSSALVVAVLAQKLELSRAEKYVHNFVQDIELDKRHKHAAANILREGWLIYRAKKRNRASSVRAHQRRLLQAIHQLRDIKTEQRRMTDSAVTIVEMSRTQEMSYDLINELHSQQEVNNKEKDALKKQLSEMDAKLNAIYTAVAPLT